MLSHEADLLKLALEAYEVYFCEVSTKIWGEMQVNTVNAVELRDSAKART